MTKVLITGGAGFIGSKLCQKLSEAGAQMRVLDNLSPQIHGSNPRPPEWLTQLGVEFIHGSVANRTVLEQALKDVEVVAHLAAETGTGQSMYEIAHYNEINTQATALLFDILANQKNRKVSRVVLTSSRSIYGEGAYLASDGARVFPGARTAAQLAAHQWEPLDYRTGHALKAVATAETDPPSPASIYAATKYAQEDIVRIGCEAFGIGYAILRLQNVYGEGQSLNNPYTGILSIFSTRIRRGLDLPLFEDAAESRDFVHVDDVAESLLRAITRQRAPNTVINVGSGTPTSVRDVAEGLARAFGQEPRVRVTGEYRLGDIRHNWADVSRLKQVLDYEPKVTLEAGLGRFAAWVGEQPLPEDQLDRANAELKQRNLMGQ